MKKDEVKISQEMVYKMEGFGKSDIWLITHHVGYRVEGGDRPESFSIHSNDMPVTIQVHRFQLEALRQEIVKVQTILKEKEGLTDAI